MPNRFGPRHLVLIMLLAALGASVWFNMLQLDRVWKRLDAVQVSQRSIEESIARLEKSVADRPATPPTARAATGDDWAIPGVAVVRRPRPEWVHDPRREPDFSVGGTITEALDAEFDSMTPYVAIGAVVRRVQEVALERLGDYHPETLEMQGVLAEAWQADPNGRWLRVKIRDDANWSDGKPVLASDVRFTIGLIKNTVYPTERFRPLYAGVSGVEVISDKVAEFRFSEAFYSNVDIALRLAPLAEHVYGVLTPERFKASTGLVFGSGPYMLPDFNIENQWAKGRPVEFVRNPRYRGDPRPADAVRFTMLKDAGARLAALEKGEADLIRATPEQVAKARADAGSGVRALAWPSIPAGAMSIIWNCGKRPDGTPTVFGDARVRLAMTRALDRERLNQDLFGGEGRVVSGPFRWDSAQADPAIRPWGFDPAAAERTLTDAGWERGDDGVRRDAEGRELAFTILLSRTLPAPEVIAAALRDRFAAVGARCETLISEGAPLQQAGQTHDFDGLVLAWSPDGPESTPQQRFHSASIAKGGENWGQWSNAKADALMDNARRELDPERRAALWRSLHAIMHAEQPHTFLLARPWFTLHSARLGNVRPTPMGLEKPEMYVRKP